MTIERAARILAAQIFQPTEILRTIFEYVAINGCHSDLLKEVKGDPILSWECGWEFRGNLGNGQGRPLKFRVRTSHNSILVEPVLDARSSFHHGGGMQSWMENDHLWWPNELHLEDQTPSRVRQLKAREVTPRKGED